MTDFSADDIVERLKPFQRDAVEHVVERFYGSSGPSRSGRFLVADETGLGKSIVARGVVARTIQQLQDDETVDRIDVIYICSNQDLARQNLQRLNVTGDPHISMATRLTLLARESKQLNGPPQVGRKRVNLVSFTPDTSFRTGGWRMGAAPERALLTVILDRHHHHDEAQKHGTRVLFRGAARELKNFVRHVDNLNFDLEHGLALDDSIVQRFLEASEESGTSATFRELRDQLTEVDSVPGELWHSAQNLIARLRQELAKAGIAALEPDLVILDEFQRFRHLMDSDASDAADLANSLFTHGDSKVLLLSATPYKPYTANGEAEDDHARDFLATLRFLAGGDETFVDDVRDAFAANRAALTLGHGQAEAADRIRELLKSVMSRSERPPLQDNQDMVMERPLDGSVPSSEDIQDWRALQRLGRVIESRFELDHWKSIPYFASFMETYRSGTRTRALLEAGAEEVADALDATRGIKNSAIDTREEVDLGNGMLRALAEETIGKGWWRLLWMPASMPYLEPGPTYRDLSADTTKHLVFSAWNGVPTAISALLSHEAHRRASTQPGAAESPSSNTRRLAWSMSDAGSPELRTLMLFWPHPGVAALADPLQVARRAGRSISAEGARQMVELDTAELAESPWSAFFSTADAIPEDVEDPVRLAIAAQGSDDFDSNFAAHLRAGEESAREDPKSHAALADLALSAPGSIAWRSVSTIAGDDVSSAAKWRAAWRISLALRALFNRTATARLLDGLFPGDLDYWQKVLAYNADGNLQAVMDEYLFQLRSELGGGHVDDAKLLQIADSAAAAVGLRTVNLEGHETTPERAVIRFPTRFAVRYGGVSHSVDGKTEQRQADVRAAFNSPFAPFILSSTSVGQEGIDFHWWSHAVVHWNLPSNPVDFEQREGRVHRFLGHAIRKNIAQKHRDDVLASTLPPWDVALQAAEDAAEEAGNAFSPWWIYEGDARILRRVASLPLSREPERYERLRRDLTRYRLTLGQPRQQDLLRVLEEKGESGKDLKTIDLSPPRCNEP